MGMINGYFGPRRLAPIGFSEHKVDQAWIIDRGRYVSDDRLNRGDGLCQGKWCEVPLGRRRGE